MFVEMKYLGGIYILVLFVNLVHLTQASTKSQPFVLMFSIVSFEVCQMVFLGISVLLNWVTFCLVILPYFDGFVQYYSVIRDTRF